MRTEPTQNSLPIKAFVSSHKAYFLDFFLASSRNKKTAQSKSFDESVSHLFPSVFLKMIHSTSQRRQKMFYNKK